MGKLIVFEGLDGCGKSTQVSLLENALTIRNADFRRIKLPDYDDKSSELVKMYLAGEFGNSADELSPFAVVVDTSNPAPDAGDATNIILWGGVAVVSAAALAVVVVMLRRAKKAEQ